MDALVIAGIVLVYPILGRLVFALVYSPSIAPFSKDAVDEDRWFFTAFWPVVLGLMAGGGAFLVLEAALGAIEARLSKWTSKTS